MNCCYSGLRIHVDITELDIPDDENNTLLGVLFYANRSLP